MRFLPDSGKVVSCALAAALFLGACGSPSPSPTGAPASPTPSATPTTPAATSVAAPPSAKIPVGFTAEGYPYRGNPEAAITLVEFSDYQCPFCRRHVLQTAPLLDQAYIATGQVKHIFRDFPLEGHAQARKAAEAARCAGAQGAEAYWAMHDRLFAGQDEWANQPDAIATFKSYASALKLDRSRFDACLDSGQTATAVEADLAAGMAAGVGGTPTFYINEWEISGAQPFSAFQQVIDAALRGEKPPPTPTPLPEGATPLSPNPDRPGYTYSGHAYKGAPEAPIIVIEISDFQCPYCKAHALDQGTAIDKEYVATGKVRVVFIHLLGHRHSQKAAEAAECAGAQGKFWEMEHLLFEKTDEWWPTSDPAPLFKAYAQALTLDTAKFGACLDNGETRQKVLADHNLVLEAGIDGTPSFLINGRLLQGSPPYETWKDLLDALLAGKNP